MQTLTSGAHRENRWIKDWEGDRQMWPLQIAKYEALLSVEILAILNAFLMTNGRAWAIYR